MKIKIPHRLRMKFVTMEGFCMDTDYYEVNVKGTKKQFPGKQMIHIELDLSNDSELLDCCIAWQLSVNDYFVENSYQEYKIDIGPYTGLWPRSISGEGIVSFNVDMADTKKGNWKDWFLEEDIEYASK